MNKITIKKIKFKLNGELITSGSTIDFKAINRKGEDVHFKNLKGLVVISAFPDINTSVCDAQTQWIAKIAAKHKEIKFLSITTDSVEKINKWCLAQGHNNIKIWSDVYKEFAIKTNSLIQKIRKLARGFLIVEDGIIKTVAYKTEIAEEPDYETIEKILT